MEAFITSIIRDLNPVEHSKIVMKDVLLYMKKLGKENKLLFFDPLDGKR
jgi:hypothetical protein